MDSISGRRAGQGFWGSWLRGCLALSLAAFVCRAPAEEARKASITITYPSSGSVVPAAEVLAVRAQAVDPAGDIRHLDFFANGDLIGSSEFLSKIAVIPGRPIPHTFEWKNPAPGKYRLVARGKDTAGAAVESEAVEFAIGEPEAPSRVRFVSSGAVWQYLNDDSVPGADWIRRGFDDAAWKSGPSPLGYGDGDEATVTREGKPPHPWTAYFRHEFQVPADLELSRLVVRLVRDDGALVRLNGKELVRSNLPEGEILPDTPASDSTEAENAWRLYSVPASNLVAGVNVLAVEIHQASTNSSDLSFDLELTGIPSDSNPMVPTTVSIVATQPITAEPSPTTRIAPGRLLISRTGATTAPLAVGIRVSGTATPDKDYQALPPAVVIPAGERSAELFVTAIDDDEVEPTETVLVELVPSAAASPLEQYLIEEARQRAEVRINDPDQFAEPRLTITQPESGTTFPVGAPIVLKAVAVDPKGYLATVQFVEGDTVIGVSRIDFIQAPAPGTPVEHTFEWKDAPAGVHAIFARAAVSETRLVRSEAVRVIVGEEPQGQLVIGVEAADPLAVEPTPGREPDRGVFRIRRLEGPKDFALELVFRLTGTAVEGRDYAPLKSTVFLAAGAEFVDVPITALADTEREGSETVVLTLLQPPCPPIEPTPPSCYRIQGPGSAELVIRDADPSANQAPRVAITSPSSGVVVGGDHTIPVTAEAVDPDGTVVKLEIYAGATLLGAGTEPRLTVNWENASAGVHRLSARAVDDAGVASTSRVVNVYVRDDRDRSFVTRDLPSAYAAGVAFEVKLSATPPDDAKAWTVEDAPPEGWTVSAISHDGSFDTAKGRVKFGPFTDTEARELVYTVTPPQNAAGPRKFRGTASLDGATLPVGGDAVVDQGGERHPADAQPALFVLTAEELTAYAAAWKSGEGWGDPKREIPANFVSRAGLLWKSGEAYRYDASAGAPPLCWVPAQSGPRLTGAPPPTGGVERQAKVLWKPGVAGGVQLVVTPPPGTRSTVIEERVPSGWVVTESSDGGQWDAAQGLVRWGVFFGEEVRTLTYTVVPPGEVASTGVFRGSASFDGVDVSIHGDRNVGAGDEDTATRITDAKRSEKGRARLRVTTPPNQVVAIEASSNLKDWREIFIWIPRGDELEIEDPGMDDVAPRYYRLRPVSGVPPN